MARCRRTFASSNRRVTLAIAGKVNQNYNIPKMNLARLEQDCLGLLDCLRPPHRIGQLRPPDRIFRFDLHKVAGNRGGHVPLLSCHAENNTRSQDLIAVLVLRRNLFKDLRRRVEYSQLKISARNDNVVVIPIGLLSAELGSEINPCKMRIMRYIFVWIKS
jgi:hypothetical protein